MDPKKVFRRLTQKKRLQMDPKNSLPRYILYIYIFHDPKKSLPHWSRQYLSIGLVNTYRLRLLTEMYWLPSTPID